ncbi:spiro-SPASM protein [Entomospira culicis]|uniref:Spiro-SPASM protein n=1 Tax=Entomospira culicis TaxID=2719989 RepID=A0A968GF43_9SPIO|nr:spiro-SPASM protein [Entomospira culicis]NIZ18902.1 spiro-SPASM protein [Entomospira culicis]NIZ69117.1 spiro-SPASM protein [Entomospira culicis]WDI37703.1 spiro-SPASM protein [Entomospira culicis]WDI39331.1 spiro-SPASM protein [Entomospira culicis]
MNKVIAVINQLEFSSYASQPWRDFANTYEALCHKLNFIKEIYTLTPQTFTQKAHITTYDILKEMQAYIHEPTIIVYVDAQAPFLDIELLKKMIQTTQQYHSQYHFAEGYPLGLCAQIIHSSILGDLTILAQEHQDAFLYKTNKYTFFFELLRSKLNDFDIETTLSPIDLREKRIELSYDNKNNAKIAEQFVKAGIFDATTLLANIAKLDQLKVGLPNYYPIQITANCPQECHYCPAPTLPNFNTNKMMDIALYKKILEKIVAFSGEAIIGLSLLGEPALHPEIASFIEITLAHPSLRLHIETSGIGWSQSARETLAQSASPRLSLILSLDSLDRREYETMRGEKFEEAIDFFHFMLENPALKERFWVQRVRLEAQEAGLQAFYHQIKEKHEQIIIQKYHNYAGLLPSQNDINIKPLTRSGCWALQREMSIYLDGSVHLCRVDVSKKHDLGRIPENSLEEIWQKQQEFYRSHLMHDYPMICANCEEYYIYTF